MLASFVVKSVHGSCVVSQGARDITMARLAVLGDGLPSRGRRCVGVFKFAVLARGSIYLCAGFSVTMEVRTVQCGGEEGPMSSCQRPGCKSWGKLTACGSLKSACIFRVPEGHGHHVGDGSRKDCACLDCAKRLGLLSGRVYHCTWCRIASTIDIREGLKHIASFVPKDLLAVCGRCRHRR